MKIKLLIELDTDLLNEGMEPEEIRFFYNDILSPEMGMVLHSNWIAETAGTVKVLSVLNDIPLPEQS